MKLQSSLLGLALVGAASVASAQSIFVENLATDGSNIDNSGVLFAYHFAGGASNNNETYTVNGVAFAPILVTDFNGLPAGVNNSTVDYEFRSGWVDTDNKWANNEWNNVGSPAVADPAPTGDLALLMDDALRTPGAFSQKSPSRLTLKGFTVGTQYQIQLLHATTETGGDFTLTGGSASETISLGTTTPAQISSITFTATGSTFDVDFTGVGGRGFLNGFAVTAIPEPSAFAALAGVFALGLVALRRRR